MKTKLLCLLCIFISFGNESFAQIYEGECEIGLLHFVNSQYEDTTAAEYKTIFKMLDTGFKNFFAFSKDRFAMVDNEGTRTVLDIKSNRSFEFKEVMDKSLFFLDSIKLDILESQEIPEEIKSSIVDSVYIKDYKFGLDCWKYTYNVEGTTLIFYVSPEVIMPFKSESADPVESGLNVESRVQDTLGNSLAFGITSFSQGISDPNILSIDTTGYQNGAALRNTVSGWFEDADAEIQQELEEFGEYQNKSSNFGIVKDLLDRNALDKDYYSMKYVLEDQKSYDIPSILLLNKRSTIGFQFMPIGEVVDVFSEVNILTPTMDLLFTKYKDDWTSHTPEIKFKAICIAAIKDHLEKSETKTQIVDNLEIMKYGNFVDQPYAKAFLNGDSGYGDLLGYVNNLQQLEYDFLISDSEISKNLEEFFNKGLSIANIDSEIIQQNETLKIKVGSEVYSFDLNEVKSQDYDNYDETLIKYQDTTYVDQSFYLKPVEVLKQISADNNKEMAYSIFHLEPPFTYDIDNYDYKEIIALFPELKIDIDAIYLNSFKKGNYDIDGSVGTSFLFHPSGDEEQIQLPNMKTGDVDAGVDFLKTSTKRNFMKFAIENEVNLSIDENDVEYLKSNIYKRLYTDPYELINKFGGIYLSLERFSNHSIDLSEGKPFKEVYRKIANYFDGRCDDWVVKKDSANKLIINTPTEEIEFKSKKELLNKILQMFDMSDVEVYKIQRLASFGVEFYLISQEQKLALESVFETSLF